jgi:hypothetical protein
VLDKQSPYYLSHASSSNTNFIVALEFTLLPLSYRAEERPRMQACSKRSEDLLAGSFVHAASVPRRKCSFLRNYKFLLVYKMSNSE